MPVLIHNAKIYLGRERFTQALLIDGDRILAVGAEAESPALLPAGVKAEWIDGHGGLVLPGFNDSHLHLWHFGCTIHEMDVHGACSIGDLVERGKRELDRLAPEPGSVIRGAGWNQEEFTGEKRYPNRFDLDRISTCHAVILERICGHTASCNTRALELAGIADGVSPAPGGHAELDREGKPLGVFHENAIEALRKLVPLHGGDKVKAQLEYGLGKALSLGISSLGGNDIFDHNYRRIIEAYRAIFDEGRLRARVTLQAHITQDSILDEFISQGWITGSSLGHPLLKMGPLKLFADGSLGSRTASMSVPYADDPGARGLRAMEADAMADAVRRYDALGFQVIIHAIGDAAADQALCCFEALASGDNPRRHGIVHCEVMSEELLERMARRHILALVQPVFLASDTAIAESRLGKERAGLLHRFGSMARLGIHTAYGTDCPVESLNPLEGIELAVRRPRCNTASGIFVPEERVDAYTAVDAYTWGGAYSVFAEGRLGRIQPGCLADLTILDRDIFTIAPEKIHTGRTILTMVGGKTAYER